jgi:hypothetical protein
MLNKKFVILLAGCLLAAGLASAGEVKKDPWHRASGNKIAFICRVSLDHELDSGFYATGLDMVTDQNKTAGYGYVSYDCDEYVFPPMYGDLGEFSEALISKGDFKKGFYLPFFSVQLFGSRIAGLKLPLGADVKFPEEAKYVYLGSFTYTLESGSLLVTKVSVQDEFDDAQAVLNQKLGKNVQLYRAELTEHQKKDKS